MAAPFQQLKMRISENKGLPWTQTHEYIDFCSTISQAGHPSAYNLAHAEGSSPTDVTQSQVGHVRLNINGLPEVFYKLWPSKEWWNHTKSAKPLAKRDVNGNIIYERTPRSWAPRELLDFPILKNLDKISSAPEPWFLELLMRMDGRIEWADLLMRMEYPGTLESDEQKFRNRLQQRVARMREKFTMVCWKDTTGTNNAIRDRVLRKLTPAQLAARDGLGSTRGSTPGSTDSQGRVVPVPGKKFRESANASNAFAQVEQPQSQFARADLSNATSQQNHPVANTNFLAVNSQQSQPSESHRGLPPYSSASSSVGLSHQLTLPIVGGRRRPNYTNTMTQQDQPAAAYASNGYTQQIQNTAPLAGLPSSHDSQHQNIDAIPSADEYVETVTSNVGGSAGHQDTPQVPYPPSSAGSDADDEDDGCDEDDDSDKSDVDCEMDDDKDNVDKVENHENDGHDRLNNDIGRLWAEASIQMATLPAEVRRETTRYYKKVGLQTLLCLHGKISVDELEMRMLKSYGEFTSGLKRGRDYDTSDDDDEVDEMQSRRAKRTKRGGKSAGSSRQSLSGMQSCASSDFDGLPPGSWGQHQRHGALINTSHRPTTRPVGSAVQRLHQNRMRRPSPKAALY